MIALTDLSGDLVFVNVKQIRAVRCVDVYGKQTVAIYFGSTENDRILVTEDLPTVITLIQKVGVPIGMEGIRKETETTEPPAVDSANVETTEPPAVDSANVETTEKA